MAYPIVPRSKSICELLTGFVRLGHRETDQHNPTISRQSRCSCEFAEVLICGHENGGVIVRVSKDVIVRDARSEFGHVGDLVIVLT